MNKIELKINEALEAFNEKHPEKKMKGKDVAKALYPDKTESRAKTLFSRIRNGYEQTSITPDIILRLCRILETSPDFLFNYPQSLK